MDSPMTEKKWTLAERFEQAHKLAQNGFSVREVIDLTGLTERTAICIVNKHKPGTIHTLGRNTIEE